MNSIYLAILQTPTSAEAMDEVRLNEQAPGVFVGHHNDRLYAYSTDIEAMKAHLGEIITPDMLGGVCQLTDNPEAPVFLAHCGETYAAEDVVTSSALFALASFGGVEAIGSICNIAPEQFDQGECDEQIAA